MVKSITPQELRSKWVNKEEVALLDVREEGPYAESHPLFAVSVPVTEINVKLPALVPRLFAPIVIYDNGEGYVGRAAAHILDIGYRDVSILEGGLSGYAAVGEVYRDVGVPSKSFGELVEAIQGTPSLPAQEAKKIIDSGEDAVVLDVRRFSEYNTMSIPSGQSCPGGELLYRIFDAAPSPDTTVIVNCAGRTRGLIGTQTLLNIGIPNKVFALRNGTIGWTLAGLDLDKQRTDRVQEPSEEAVLKARAHAEAWAREVGVPIINADKLNQLAASAEARTLYLLDVRDPDEYAKGHPPGFSSAPGGQLVQATDELIGVRGARVVLYDNDGVRARITGSWLHQMGWEVYVLAQEASEPDTVIKVDRPIFQIPKDGKIRIDELPVLQHAAVTVIDVARSTDYVKGHIPGAKYASGPEILRVLETAGIEGPIALTSPDGKAAIATFHYLKKVSQRDVFWLEGGTNAWSAAGNPLEIEPHWLSEPIDVYNRPYEGTASTREAMEGYIEWEHGLVAQLANDGISGFRVVRTT